MRMKLLCGSALLAMLVLVGVAVAQKPVANIDARKHPNLAAAQRHIIEAYQETETARTDNHFDLGGHGEKAAELLSQADRELKEAAEFANAHPRK